MKRVADESVKSESTSSSAGLRGRWWFSASLFAAGVVVGVVTVGLLNLGTPDFVPAVSAADPNPRPRASLEVAAEARVNDACLRVINDALDVQRALAGVGDAATDVDLQRLDDIVRQLQPVEPRLAENLANCSVSASAADPVPSVPPATPSDTPSPTASPTR